MGNQQNRESMSPGSTEPVPHKRSKAGRAGGARSRRKGTRAEMEIVRILREAGIPAQRVPLSGAAGGRFRDDVLIGDGLRAEVKIRADGLTTLYRLLGRDDGPVTTLAWAVAAAPGTPGLGTIEQWLGTADVLFVRTNRAPWVAVTRQPGGQLRIQPMTAWIADWLRAA